MKKLFVFVPAILLVLFILNSFALKEKNEACIVRIKSVLVDSVLKSTDGGQTWQAINEAPPEMERPEQGSNIVKSEGIIVATDQKGIRRSTDNGEHWQWVISEGGVGIAIERIKGGFAAITYNSSSNTRRVRTSYDGGETWQSIDEGLPPSSLISSIKQMDKNLICGHPNGIFLSSNMGKTWNKVHPGFDKDEFTFLTIRNVPSSPPNKVFKIFISGNVLYAVAVSAGC